MLPQEYFDNLYLLIKKFLSEYRKSVVNRIMLNEDYIDEPKRFFYTLLHKTASTIDAANIYVYNFERKRDFHSALFIIFRATISDLMVAEYIIHCSQSEDDSVDKIQRLYFDHIDNIVKLCNTTFRHINQWSEMETESQIKILTQNSRFYENGKPKYKPLQSSMNKIVVELFASNKNKKFFLLHKRAFELYHIFSKLEHLGELSFEMIHRGYDDEKQLNLWYDLYDTLLFIFQLLTLYPNIWGKDIEYDEKYFQSILQQIKELDPKIIK